MKPIIKENEVLIVMSYFDFEYIFASPIHRCMKRSCLRK